MLALHTPTIAAMATLYAFLLALCFFAFSRILTERAVAERFAVGNILFGVGALARLLGNESGSLATVYVTWLTLPCALAVQYSAVRMMSGLSSQDRRLLAGIGMHALVLAVTMMVWKQERLMGIPTVITAVTLVILQGRAFSQIPGDVLKPVRRFMLFTFSCLVILAVTRIIVRLDTAGKTPDLTAIALSQFGFTLILVVMNLCYIVTMMLLQQQIIGRLASADPLTSVLNRQGLEAGLARIFAHGKRRLTGSVLLLNIDRFKSINDNLGHSSGDAVLRDLGIALRARMRKGDLLGRTGGKEFCILLPGTHIAAAQVIAERLRIEMGERSISTSQFDHINITVSIGVADFDIQSPQLDAMLQRADIALHTAKSNGRNRTEVWNPQLEAMLCAPRVRGARAQHETDAFQAPAKGSIATAATA
jgi:diguanylate cyclase (GGDEF)-like protein